VPIVLKSGSLKLLEPSGPVKACNGGSLPLHFCRLRLKDNIKMGFREVGYEVANLNKLALDKDHWPYFENTVTKKDFVVREVMPCSLNGCDSFLNNFAVCMSCSYNTLSLCTGP
jgi:hypothetical protein